MAPATGLTICDADYVLENKDWRWLLSAIKGLRNGIVYGVRIRAPHALVMTFLFGKGNIAQKLLAIVRATATHSKNLSSFVFCYKLLIGWLAHITQQKRQVHVFLSAFSVGYFVFGSNNAINMQINLYLLSRILLGLSRLAVDKGYIHKPYRPVFPLFAATVWGIVLWLFEFYPETLQNSLQQSMTYLYHDSDKWTRLKDFILYNKL